MAQLLLTMAIFCKIVQTVIVLLAIIVIEHEKRRLGGASPHTGISEEHYSDKTNVNNIFYERCQILGGRIVCRSQGHEWSNRIYYVNGAGLYH